MEKEQPRKSWSLMGLEWRWSLANMLWGVPAVVVSFAVPAWAARAANVFSEYAPLSWVIAGFAGMLLAATTYAVVAWAKSKWVRAKYDERLLPRSGPIDPLAKTFERQRIYLNELVLPSTQFIEEKTFIDCEIVGPANVVLQFGNQHADQRVPVCDAVLIREDARVFNAYHFTNCTFRRCSFHRITLFIRQSDYDQGAKDAPWLNYVTYPGEPVSFPFMNRDEEPRPPQLPGTGPETQP